MGAWGLGPFENDGALDWLVQLRSGGIDAVGSAFADMAAEPGYLELYEGQNALAAAEILAAAHGRPAEGLPREVARIVADRGERLAAESELVGLAREALARILAENSEIAELWDDTPSGPDWRRRVSELDQRLGGIQTP